MYTDPRPDILEPWTGKWIPTKREVAMKIENSSITLDNCDGCRTGKKVPVITFYHRCDPVICGGKPWGWEARATRGNVARDDVV